MIAGDIADRAGFKAGDRVLAVNGEPMMTRDQLIEAISRNDGRPIDVTVAREGRELRLTAVPEKRGEDRAKLFLYLGEATTRVSAQFVGDGHTVASFDLDLHDLCSSLGNRSDRQAQSLATDLFDGIQIDFLQYLQFRPKLGQQLAVGTIDRLALAARPINFAEQFRERDEARCLPTSFRGAPLGASYGAQCAPENPSCSRVGR